jgi:hypothetical protein
LRACGQISGDAEDGRPGGGGHCESGRRGGDASLWREFAARWLGIGARLAERETTADSALIHMRE